MGLWGLFAVDSDGIKTPGRVQQHPVVLLVCPLNTSSAECDMLCSWHCKSAACGSLQAAK